MDGNGSDGATPAATAAVRGPRLAPGALHGIVEDYLREHPGEEFGPTKIGHDLGRSSGAVGNALARLVATGYAVRTKDRPSGKRWRRPDPPTTPTPVLPGARRVADPGRTSTRDGRAPAATAVGARPFSSAPGPFVRRFGGGQRPADHERGHAHVVDVPA